MKIREMGHRFEKYMLHYNRTNLQFNASIAVGKSRFSIHILTPVRNYYIQLENPFQRLEKREFQLLHGICEYR